MVGGVESGTLEHDPDRLEYFFQGFLSAFRTAHERFILEGLLFIELQSTIVTPIGIDWHTDFILNGFRLNDWRVIIAHSLERCKRIPTRLPPARSWNKKAALSGSCGISETYYFKIVTIFEITTAAKTRISGRMPIFRNRRRLLTFLVVPVLVNSFWISRAIKTRMPMIAKDPARVTVETVEVVTVEIMGSPV
jgi:hypothetical protein